MIKYKATYPFPEIQKVEVIKETEKTVYIGDIRENKVTSYYFYGNTYQEAKEWLLDKILESKNTLRAEILDREKKIEGKDKLFCTVYNWEEE